MHHDADGMQCQPYDPVRDKAMDARMALRTDILWVILTPLAVILIARQPFDAMSGLAIACYIFVFMVSAYNLWRWRQGPHA